MLCVLWDIKGATDLDLGGFSGTFGVIRSGLRE
jgi:hypothetical protein